jgi:hypothetical protein
MVNLFCGSPKSFSPHVRRFCAPHEMFWCLDRLLIGQYNTVRKKVDLSGKRFADRDDKGGEAI